MTSYPDPGDLAALEVGWARMLRLAESALSHATAALFDGDLAAVARQSPSTTYCSHSTTNSTPTPH